MRRLFRSDPRGLLTLFGLRGSRHQASQARRAEQPQTVLATPQENKSPIRQPKLIALTLKRPDVAPAGVLFVRTRHAALIGLQQMTKAVRATTRVSGINGRTTR